jgi:hypothetical protein
MDKTFEELLDEFRRTSENFSVMQSDDNVYTPEELNAAYDERQAARAELLAAFPRWIPVSEDEPKMLVPVLIIEKELGVITAHRLVGTFKGFSSDGLGGILCEAEYYMPLDALPELPIVNATE